MALKKLSAVIAEEYEAPYPDRKTALAHLKQRYHCEKRGTGKGSWWVDRSRPILRSTGNARLDAIVADLGLNNG